MRAECFEEFVLLVFEEVFVLFNKLSDKIIEQLNSVWKVHHIVIGLATNAYNFFENCLLGQKLEAVLILTELLENSASVEGHLIVVSVFVWELIN